MNAANTVLSVFAVLVAAWAWLCSRNAMDGVAKVLRLLNARVGKLVDEAERKPVHFVEGRKVHVGSRPVEEAAPRADGGEPPAAPLPGRAAPSPRPADDSTVEEAPVDAKSGRNDDGPAPVAPGLPRPASPRPSHGGGKQGPSQETRELAAKAKEILAKRGDVSPADLRDGLGLTIKGFAKVRALLNADPDVIVYGETKLRRYKLRDGAPTAARRQRIAAESTVDGRSPKLPSTPGPKGDRQQPTIDGQVMSSIQLVPKSASAIAQERNLALDVVVPALRRLEAEGDVRRHESGNWVAVP